MTTYCECTDVATKFFDDEGNDLQEPCCDQCWYFQLEQNEIVLQQNSSILLTRSLRIAVIQNLFDQDILTEIEAKELLSGPLTPGDNSTVFDDSTQLVAKTEQR